MRLAICILLAAQCSSSAATRVYTYWFSAQQRSALNDIAAVNNTVPQHYFVKVNNAKKEYTECNSIGQPFGRFTDYTVVGTATHQACKPW